MQIVQYTAIGLILGALGAPTPVQNMTIAPIVVQEIKLKDKLLAADIEARQHIVRSKIDEVAREYGVSADRMYSTMAECENPELDPNLQSRVRYSYSVKEWGVDKGDREESYGLSMIHLPSHPDITVEQATDPEFAIDFMAKEFAAGRASKWTCYRLLYKTSTQYGMLEKRKG